MRALHVLVASVVLIGCGPTYVSQPAARRPGPSRPVAQFPEVQRVEVALRAEPPDLAALLPHNQDVRVADWVVESEPAPGDPPYTADGDPFEALLDSVAEERGIELARSASLRCAAHELARFYARHDGLPSDDITGFILAACGSSVLSATRAGTVAHVHGNVSLERLATMSGERLRESLGHGIAEGQMHGLGVAREGDAIAVVVMSAPRNAQLVPWGPPNELDEVHIQGRIAAEGDALVAYVNQGALGVAPCRVEPMVRLPAIDVRCPMAEGDGSALVNFETVTIGRVLARRAATIMLRREGVRPELHVTPASSATETAATEAATTEAAATAATAATGTAATATAATGTAATGTAATGTAATGTGTSETAATETAATRTAATDLRAALLAHLNEARARAGVAPLTLAERESEVHARAVPFSAAATITGDETTGEIVGLGLMAGWAVQGGTIRFAHHLTDIELATRSPAQWVESVLSQPIGRLLLLRPDARRAAIGVITLDDPEAFIATVTTYSFFEGLDHDADVERLFARIERERTARGLPPPRRMQADVLRAQAAHVSRGEAEPAAAFQLALNEESRRWQQSLSGLQFEAIDLDLAPLPDALFARRELSLGIAIAHTRAPGAAWGQYVVYFMMGR